MGNCTVTLQSDAFSPIDANAGWMARGTVTLSSAYATGGDAITPALLGLGTIRKFLVMPTSDSWVLRYNATNATIQAFGQNPTSNTAGVIALSEAAANTNLAAVTGDFVAYG